MAVPIRVRGIAVVLAVGVALPVVWSRREALGSHVGALTLRQASACEPVTREPSPLRLEDGRGVYVEPMALARGSTPSVLAGYPVYVWKRNGLGAEWDSAAAAVGVVLGDASGARLLPPPQVGQTTQEIITHLRLTPSGAGYLAVAFAVATPPPAARPGHEHTVVAYWFGRTDGVRWDSLESLPLPAGGTLQTREASQLLRDGQSFVIAVPYATGAGTDVAIYTRERERWRRDTLGLERVSYVALAASPAGPLLYVVQPDTGRGSDSNSLSLFARVGGTWHDRGFLLHGGRFAIHHPVVSAQGGIQTLTWVTDGQPSGRVAHAARLRSDGTLGATTTLANQVEDVTPVLATDGPTRWVANVSDRGQLVLALIEWSGNEPTIRDLVVNPFTGWVASFAAETSDVVFGPVLNRAPGAEALLTGMMPMAPRCIGKGRGGKPG